MVDLNSTGLDTTKPGNQNFLNSIQGNILKGHGRNHTANIFIKIDGRKTRKAKNWITNYSMKHITSALEQIKQSERFREKVKTNYQYKGEIFSSFNLSASGYKKLGFETTQFENSFKKGMRKANLNDRIKDWEKGFLYEEIHAMILLAHSDKASLNKACGKVLDELSDFSKILALDYGDGIQNANGQHIEHFGYADGISQPLFYKNDIEKYKSRINGDILSDPSSTLRLVLTKDPFGSQPEDLGSYMVYRKLEQNVQDFKKEEIKKAKELGLSSIEAERFGAMVVGRFKDGTPVTSSSTNGLNDFEDLHNFDFQSDDGSKCPFHSHIRKSHPRNGQRLIARRGITYGNLDVDILENPTILQSPKEKVGLLFMCFQESISSQFEFMQQSWVNSKFFPTGDNGADPLIGQSEVRKPGKLLKNSNKYPLKHGVNHATNFKPISMSNFVIPRGGEYFFTPSISFLVNVNK